MRGAAGAFEAFATVMSVAEQCVPGTLNFRDVDPECDLWVEADMGHAETSTSEALIDRIDDWVRSAVIS